MEYCFLIKYAFFQFVDHQNETLPENQKFLPGALMPDAKYRYWVSNIFSTPPKN